MKAVVENVYLFWKDLDENNKDLDKLFIDHIKEVRQCYDEGLSLTECCDISNLQVITMRENILKSNPKANI